jgi:acetolactate synthase-1/2/3 large subunit
MLEDDVGTVLERSDYHEVAAALGGRGVLLKYQDRVEACVNEARYAAGEGNPVLLNAWLDKTDFREGSLSL